MPTQQIPSKEELLTLSEQLKRRLTAATRGRKSSLTAELRQELLDALDHLADLALEKSIQELDAVRSSTEFALTDLAATGSQASEAPNSASLALSADDLTRIVSEAVVGSLSNWQDLLKSSLIGALPEQRRGEPVEHKTDELSSLLIKELEEDLSDTRIQLNAANSQLTDYHAEVKHYRERLEQAEYRIAEVELEPLHASGNDDDLSDQLKRQLEETLDELAELRQQNSELAAKLAQQAACSVTSNSAGRGKDAQLTWEERKLLILKQLETAPTDSDTDETAAIESNDRLQEVMEASQREIARRDAEIDELREIVRMQSDARAGLAIGATGLAQLIDSDELIQQERRKLQEIQQEWEDKLRQAEIDLSMERAKIARERIAMEKEKEELSRLEPANLPKEKCIENRWLRILGLNSQPND